MTILYRSVLAMTLVFCWGALNVVDGQVGSEKKKPVKQLRRATIGKIEQHDPAFAELIDTSEKIEVLKGGFKWSEGPVWIKSGGYLLFSDVPKNKIHKWHPKDGHSVFMNQSGFEGETRNREPGSNGLMVDPQGRLVVCDHGNRRVYCVEKDGTKTTLADNFKGKKFNSPNDLVINANGDIYFTDPPYGLGGRKSELNYFGVYRLTPDGKITLMTKELTRPNGIALSPDEKTLYVAQSHKPAPIYQSYAIKADGTTDNEGKLLFDAGKFARAGDPGMPDGMCVDVNGNLWATGPGGVLIISPKGKLLGRLNMGQPTANCAWGDDGSTLYITSNDRLCRVKTKTKGLGFD